MESISMNSDKLIMKFLMGHFQFNDDEWTSLKSELKTLGLPDTFYDVRYVQYLIENNLPLSELHKDTLEKYSDVIKHSTPMSLNNELIEIYEVVINKFKTLDTKVSHSGYPLVHPVFGRPCIGWKVCYHAGCGKKFSTSRNLIIHLQLNKAHTAKFHVSHEEAYKSWSPEKIIAEGHTKCKASICNKGEFGTPQHLIDHLEELGIKPFWHVKYGTEFPSKDDYPKTIKTEESLKKPKTVILRKPTLKECIVCHSNLITSLFGPCGHRIACLNCVNKYGFSRCSLCRQKVEFILPYV